MPPFTLGGSLERDDYLDFGPYGPGLYAGRWVPPKKGPDFVEVDWSQFANVDLMVDATVRGGTCQVGLVDVENNIPVAHSDWVSGPPISVDWTTKFPVPPSPAELVRVRFVIPHQVGRRKYRLGLLPSSKGGSTLWVKAAITFPSFSFGSGAEDWFAPNDGDPLSGQTPNSVAVSIDWSKLLKDPIHTVVAAFRLTVANRVRYGYGGKGRVRLVDLADKSKPIVTTEWTEPMGPSMHRQNYAVTQDTRVALPQTTGVHRYALEVEISGTDAKASVVGDIELGH